MLGLHRTPEGLGTDLRPKNDQIRGYSGVGLQGRMFLLCYSTEGHTSLLNNSGLLLKSTNSTTVFSQQKRSWNLLISLASDPTRNWILLWSQVFAGWSLITRWPRKSFGTIVNRSQVSIEIFISCKLLPSQTGNSRRSRPSLGSVADLSQNITGQSEFGRKCITAVGPWLWFWGPSLCR